MASCIYPRGLHLPLIVLGPRSLDLAGSVRSFGTRRHSEVVVLAHHSTS